MSDTDTLTHDQAHQLLMADEAPEAVVAEEIVQAEEPEAEAEPVEGVEEATEEAETEEAEAEPVAAPDKWDAEDKAWFAEQPPEVQSKILEQETKREAVLAKAKEKVSAEARKEVEGELQQVKAVADSLKTFLPKAVAAFQADYGEPDWKATLQQYGSEATMQMQIEYNERLSQLQSLQRAADEAQALADEQRVKEESRKLVELAPELASDATKQKEVATYVLSSGATSEELNSIPAWGAALAYKAYLYDKAQAEAKAAPPTPKAPAKPVLKPAAAQAATPTQRTEQQLRNRLAQTGDRETAHALLMLKGI